MTEVSPHYYYSFVNNNNIFVFYILSVRDTNPHVCCKYYLFPDTNILSRKTFSFLFTVNTVYGNYQRVINYD